MVEGNSSRDKASRVWVGYGRQLTTTADKTEDAESKNEEKAVQMSVSIAYKLFKLVHTQNFY